MTSDTAADYAFWTSPDQALTINYSLEQFHEIDFQVNEGYRRIPHGGIEIGGLLFGRGEASGVRIQAFRLIECEHATGPSFSLSERDLDRLQKQIADSASDPELAGLELVGWFIAHTRSPLRMSEREIAIFERFFPSLNQVVLLVKPERFQPTRFGFLVRKPDGSIERDATNTAVILPLPGRSPRESNRAVASIPAPLQTPPIPVAKPAQAPQATLPVPVIEPPPAVQPRRVMEPPLALQPPPAIEAPAESPIPVSERHKATRIRTTAPPEDAPVPPVSPAAAPNPQSVTSLTVIPKEEKLPSISDIRRRRSETAKPPSAIEDESRAYNLRLALVLLFAGALGCGVGYWGYRELPPPVVPLAIHSQSSGLMLTWPRDQTVGAGYAAIRVNDGAQQPLSREEKTGGAALLTTQSRSNIKVELIVQHWMRDSRGIVRYLSPTPAAPVVQEQGTER